MNQGWHECNNNTMCFYPRAFNLLRIAYQLSTCEELTAIEKKGIRLNPLVKLCACNGALKDLRMNDGKEIEKRNNNEDAHHDEENDTPSEWKEVPRKQNKNTHNNKIKENKNKACV